MRSEVRRILPFRLTKAQKRVVKEIADDLRSDRPMYRLLQGDVGSGKTIVALIAAILMIRNGHQVALLAPTEILVEQHHQRIRQLVDGSLVVAMYGDLELSVIDELPPGRRKIKTAVRAPSHLEKVYRFIDGEISDGAQAYIVYPIIEESEKLNLRPLKQGFEAIRKRFPDRQVAMMHGRMTPADKEATMQRFKDGEIDILVSTTVIEVGIDV